MIVSVLFLCLAANPLAEVSEEERAAAVKKWAAVHEQRIERLKAEIENRKIEIKRQGNTADRTAKLKASEAELKAVTADPTTLGAVNRVHARSDKGSIGVLPAKIGRVESVGKDSYSVDVKYQLSSGGAGGFGGGGVQSAEFKTLYIILSPPPKGYTKGASVKLSGLYIVRELKGDSESRIVTLAQVPLLPDDFPASKD